MYITVKSGIFNGAIFWWYFLGLSIAKKVLNDYIAPELCDYLYQTILYQKENEHVVLHDDIFYPYFSLEIAAMQENKKQWFFKMLKGLSTQNARYGDGVSRRCYALSYITSTSQCFHKKNKTMCICAPV